MRYNLRSVDRAGRTLDILDCGHLVPKRKEQRAMRRCYQCPREVLA